MTPEPTLHEQVELHRCNNPACARYGMTTDVAYPKVGPHAFLLAQSCCDVCGHILARLAGESNVLDQADVG